MDLLNIESFKKYGYVRVNSKSKNSTLSTKSQIDQLKKLLVPPEHIWVEVEVGSSTNEIKNSPVFSKLLNQLKSEDVLIVTKINVCSRSTLEFLKLQNILYKLNVTFIALDLPKSADLVTNKLIARTLAGLADFEQMKRKERQKQGIQIAKLGGKRIGRKTVIDKKLISQVQDLKENKNLPITKISQILNVSRPTVYKILKNELNYRTKPTQSIENDK